MSRLIGIAIGIALFSCVACGGQHPASTQHPVRPVIPGAQPSVPAPAGAVSALPTLASLPRTASAANTLWGIQVAQARYATGADTSLVFANKSDDGSGDTIIQPRPAFAVYEFGDQPTPVGLHLTTSSNSQTKFWLGLANWQTGQWDFSPGQFLSSPTIQYAQMIANPDAYRSADGRVAIAVVVTGVEESVSINQVKLFAINETTNFTASTDRWDGVKLSWDASNTVSSYRILRHPNSDPSATPVTLGGDGTEYPEYTSNVLDTEAAGGADYTYLLQTGYSEPVDGYYTTFWSAGVETSGRRRDNQLDPSFDAIGAYATATSTNQLGFVINQGSAGDQLSFVKSSSYPPAPEWVTQQTPDGTPLVSGLSSSTDWPRPFYVRADQETDDPAFSLCYGTADGVFSRIGYAAEDGSVVWGDPSRAREAGNYLLGVCELPQMLGVLTWNDAAQEIELNNSHDELGQTWYNYGTDGWPWYVVSSRKPAEGIDIDNEADSVWLCYREAGTQQAVIMFEANNSWQEDSPNIPVGPNPVVRHMLKADNIAPALGCCYLTTDSLQLRLLRKDDTAGWDETLSELVASPPDGQTIGEFTLYVPSIMSGGYLLYTAGGQLFGQFCANAKLSQWSAPHLIGSAKAIHHPRIQVVGTGPNFSSGTYATWLADTDDGPRIMFYDLRSIDFYSGTTS